MGGGGQDNIIDPPSKDYPQPSVDPVDPPAVDPVDPIDPPEPIVQEITYDYTKTYEDYFIDYEIPTELGDISMTTVTGSGTEADPYIINSTEDFLFMSKQSLSYKYIELACDIELNDETFDENGQASGGDGNVYTWEPITTWTKCHFDGNGYTISNYYFNDANTDQEISLLGFSVESLMNLNVKGMYLCGNSGVIGISTGANTAVIENVHNLGGTLKGNERIAGICRAAKSLTNVTNRANVCQHSTASGGSYIAGICCGLDMSYTNCINYGNVEVYKAGYCGGITQTLYGLMENCKNYGNIVHLSTNGSSGFGGLVGMSGGATIQNCVNYGYIKSAGGYAAAICGVVYDYTRELSVIKDCINYGDCYRATAFVGCAESTSFINCVNYGDITNANLFMTQPVTKEENFIFKNCKNFSNWVGAPRWDLSIFSSGSNSKYQIMNCEVKCYIKGELGVYSGLFGHEADTDAQIINSKFDIRLEQSQLYYLMKGVAGKAKVHIKNTIFNVENGTFNFVNRLVGNGRFDAENIKINATTSSDIRLVNYKEANSTLNLKNILINVVSDGAKSSKLKYCNNMRGEYFVDGVVAIKTFSDGTAREYIASDEKGSFDDFYWRGKTATIGLSTMDAVGAFYDPVDEALLESKLFTKVEI